VARYSSDGCIPIENISHFIIPLLVSANDQDSEKGDLSWKYTNYVIHLNSHEQFTILLYHAVANISCNWYDLTYSMVLFFFEELFHSFKLNYMSWCRIFQVSTLNWLIKTTRREFFWVSNVSIQGLASQCLRGDYLNDDHWLITITSRYSIHTHRRPETGYWRFPMAHVTMDEACQSLWWAQYLGSILKSRATADLAEQGGAYRPKQWRRRR
jgi:hypothetical protein